LPGASPGRLKEVEYHAFLGHVSLEDGLSSRRRTGLRRACPSAIDSKTPRCNPPHVSIPPYTGGREGRAMLNRTNRTLSANSFGLNLGTRSFARISGNNMSLQTLRLRHIHHDQDTFVVDPVRAGIVVGSSWPSGCAYPISPIPASSSASPSSFASSEMRSRVAAVVPAMAVERRLFLEDCLYSMGMPSGRTMSKPKAQSSHPAVKPQQGDQRRARARQVPVARGATCRMTLAAAAAAAAAAQGAASGG
jgi:hypothetical protein